MCWSNILFSLHVLNYVKYIGFKIKPLAKDTTLKQWEPYKEMYSQTRQVTVLTFIHCDLSQYLVVND